MDYTKFGKLSSPIGFGKTYSNPFSKDKEQFNQSFYKKDQAIFSSMVLNEMLDEYTKDFSEDSMESYKYSKHTKSHVQKEAPNQETTTQQYSSHKVFNAHQLTINQGGAGELFISPFTLRVITKKEAYHEQYHFLNSTQLTTLLEAYSFAGDLELVHYILEYSKILDSSTSLIIAAKQNHSYIIDCLLSPQYLTSVTIEFLGTTFNKACTEGDTKLVQLLMGNDTISPHIKTKDQGFKLAYTHHNYEIVSYLLVKNKVNENAILEAEKFVKIVKEYPMPDYHPYMQLIKIFNIYSNQGAYALTQEIFRNLEKEDKNIEEPNNSSLKIKKKEKTLQSVSFVNSYLQFPSFFSFKKIGGWFGFTTKEEKELYITVQSLIHNNLLDKVFEIISKGYQLNSNLQKQFDEHFDKIIHNQPFGLLEKVISKGVTIEDKYLLKILFSKNSNFIFNLGYDDIYNEELKEVMSNQIGSSTAEVLMAEKFPHLTNLMMVRLNDQQFRKSLFDIWTNAVDKITSTTPKEYKDIAHIRENSDYNILKQINSSYYGLSLVFSDIPMNTYLQYMTKLTNYSQQLIDFKKELKNQHTQVQGSYTDFSEGVVLKELLINSKNNMKKQMDILYSREFNALNAKVNAQHNGDIVEQVVNNMKDRHSTNEDKEDSVKLPEEAKQLLDLMKEKYHILQSNHISLGNVVNYDVENIVNNRIPEILNKYFDIDFNSRDKLIHTTGKSATEIMIQSLTNIYHILEHLVEQVNEEKVNSLNVSQRYTEMIKSDYLSSDKKLFDLFSSTKPLEPTAIKDQVDTEIEFELNSTPLPKNKTKV